MRICVLMGSPRHANTEALCRPFIDRLREGGAETEYFSLAEMDIAPCRGCYKCQQVSGEYGCCRHDDMYKIVDAVIAADCIVLATPIYTWYCTAEMKAVLDRFFGMNKFYGSGSGALWSGKSMALITTHGYDREYGAGPFEEGMKRLCEHSKLTYLGMYSVRDIDDLASFTTDEAVSGARDFAAHIVESMRKER